MKGEKKSDINSLIDQYEGGSDRIDDLLQHYEAPKGEHSLSEKMNARIQGAGNTFSGGLLPKLQAGFNATSHDPHRDLDADLKSKGFKINQPNWNSYQDQLQQTEADLSRTEEEMPDEYYQGAMGAVGAGLLGAGASAAKSSMGKGMLGLLKSPYAKKAAEYGVPLYVLDRILSRHHD
jgi:hypothetical protein